MNCLKLYATGSTSASAVASVIIPSKARIRAVQWAAWYDSITDNANATLELSRASATEIAVNGSQQCISEIRFASNFLTSGLSQGGVNIFVPVDVAVVQGQIIYCHASIGGTIVYYASAIIWYA